tara:strand:- start:1202 stop:1771 length:570 start_codon:yes stop_codon:yes gene_type:complete
MAQDIQVIDNFLTEEEFQPLSEYLLGPSCPWSFNEGIINPGIPKDSWQMVHTFYVGPQISPALEFMYPIIGKLDPLVLLRIKANLIPKAPLITVTKPYHEDWNGLSKQGISYMTGILYVNTCNGYTEFQNGEKVDSVANRFVSFPGDMYHGGSTTTNDIKRVVVNINWIPEPKNSNIAVPVPVLKGLYA